MRQQAKCPPSSRGFSRSYRYRFRYPYKYDSSAKGGVVISLGKDLGLPLAFITNGERYTDIEPFAKSQFWMSLLVHDAI